MDEERASMLPMIAAGEIHQTRESLPGSTDCAICGIPVDF